MSFIAFKGNLAEDPTLRYTKTGGRAVANLRVVENTGQYDRESGRWTQDDNPNGYNVTIWGSLAENVAESLNTGDPVVGHGRITTDAYTTDAGEKRTRQIVTADALGPDLRFAAADVTRTSRQSESTESN